MITLPETSPRRINHGLLLPTVRSWLVHWTCTSREGRGAVYTRLELQPESGALSVDLGADTDINLQGLPSSDREGHSDRTESKTTPYMGKTYTRKVVLQTLSVSLLAFHKMPADVLLAVFLATPTATNWMSSGFGLSTVEIGYLLTSQAIVMTAAQSLAVPKLIDLIGTLKLYRWALLAFPLIYVLVPFCVMFSRPFSIITILPLAWCFVILVSIGYTCCSIL